MNKFYIYSENSENLENDFASYLKYKEKDPTLKLVLIAEKDEVLDVDFASNAQNTVQYFYKSGKVRPHDIIIAIEGEDSDLPASQWEKVKKAEEKLNKHGLTFAIHDYSKLWTIKEVENANSQIASSADKLRGKNFSPLEKLLSAYFEVTKRNYKYEDATEHYANSRSVFGVLNKDSIVCVGFASLLKAIIEKEGDGNIKIYNNTVATSDDNIHIRGKHRNLIVYIKDDKYGVDGYYYLDPTWDASKGTRRSFNLNYFLIPLKDIKQMKVNIRAFNITLQPSPSAPGHKPHISVKRQKAIAKNKHQKYNKAVVGFNSITSDNYIISKKNARCSC